MAAVYTSLLLSLAFVQTAWAATGSPDLDPITFFTFVAGLFLSQQAAQYAGPYAVIFLSAATGAAASLQKKDSVGRYRSFVFFTWTCVAAVLLTVPGARWLASYQDNWEAQWFFAPVAFVIAYFGDRAEELGRFGFELFKSWLTLWLTKGVGKEKKDD